MPNGHGKGGELTWSLRFRQAWDNGGFGGSEKVTHVGSDKVGSDKVAT